MKLKDKVLIHPYNDDEPHYINLEAVITSKGYLSNDKIYYWVRHLGPPQTHYKFVETSWPEECLEKVE